MADTVPTAIDGYANAGHHSIGEAAHLLDLALVATALRLPLGAVLAVTVALRHALLSAILLAVFVAVDVADGALARRAGHETPLRRALDGSIDRVVTHVCLGLGVAMYVPLAAPFWLVILARDTDTSVRNVRLFRRTRVVLAGRSLHKLGSLAQAAFGFALLTRSVPTALAAGSAATVVSIALWIDYLAAQRAAEQTFTLTGPSIVLTSEVGRRHKAPS